VNDSLVLGSMVAL